MRGMGAQRKYPNFGEIREERPMSVTGRNSVFQRAHCSGAESIPQFPKPVSILLRPGLLASAALGAFLAGGSVARATGTITALVRFNGNNGSHPQAGLFADAAGNLYGTTYLGGATGGGSAFEIAAGTHAFSTVATFDYYSTQGANPVGLLIGDSAGNLFGATSQRSGGYGTVYKIAAATHEISVLMPFNTGSVGGPSAGVIADAAGNLYGTTSNIVFEIPQAPFGTPWLFTLATLNAGVQGGLIMDASGNLYGTTNTGGSNFVGTAFKVTPSTFSVATLATFNDANGANPSGGVIADAAGNVYGTTTYGGANGLGTVFEISASTHALSTLATFDDAHGAAPVGNLIFDAAGDLFGTTYYGGANGEGVVFKVAAGTHALSVVASFNYDITGGSPTAGLIADAAGNLYGTAYWGGDGENGTVFEVTDSGFVTSAPEPAAPSLIGLTGLGLLARRRRSLPA